MRVCVTGAAGFVGSVLCARLLEDGYSVTALDNFRHGVPSFNYLCAQPSFRLVRGDARDKSVLTEVLADADVLIPLAALVGVNECLKDEFAARSTNLEAIKLLLDLRSSSQVILYPNTNSGYGIGGEAICTEESPLKPISLYGWLKCEAEERIVAANNFTGFRLATVFGCSPRMRWSLLVNQFCLRAAQDRAIVLFESSARRNFIHIRDVAGAFVWAIENPGIAGSQIFNLGLDEANLTKRQLAEKIATHTEFHITEAPFATDPDRRDYYVSSQKLYDAGFKPIHSLDDGIDELLKGARQFSFLE